MSDHEVTEREALNRYWDAVARGEPASPTDLDPTLAMKVRQLQEAYSLPFAGRLWREILRAQPKAARRIIHRPGLRALLVAVVPLLALVLAAGAASLQGWGSVPAAPVPASAQVVLQRAVAALPPITPDAVFHQVRREYYPPDFSFGFGDPRRLSEPITYTLDEWTRTDAGGAISRQVTVGMDGRGALLYRTLRSGDTVRTYEAAERAVETLVIQGGGGWRYQPDALLGVADLRQLAAAARRHALPGLRLLPPQRLDGGALVYVVALRGAAFTPDTDLRVYIDARTYRLRGYDTTVGSGAAAVRGRGMRVLRSALVPPGAVPAATFAWRVPAGTRVLPPLSRRLDVAQAVALPSFPALLLGRPVAGLRLSGVIVNTDSPFITYSYDAVTPAGAAGPGRTFIVEEAPGATFNGSGPSALNTEHRLELTIAGQRVRASEDVFASGLTPAHATVVFQDGATGVSLFESGLTAPEFDAAIRALVDGRTHPEVVRRLQRDLDLATTNR